MYNKLSSPGIDKSPLKIKIWLWLSWHNAFATKDNMKKRKWVGDFSCGFCHANETISHMFFHALLQFSLYVVCVISSSFAILYRPTCFF